MDEDLQKRSEELMHMSDREFLQYVEARKQRHVQNLDTLAIRACGTILSDKFTTFEDALRGLSCTDANTRRLALFSLISQWKTDIRIEHLTQIDNMASSDPDETVRSLAANISRALY